MADSIDRFRLDSIERTLCESLVKGFHFSRDDIEQGRIGIRFDYEHDEGGGLEIVGDISIRDLIYHALPVAAERWYALPDTATMLSALEALDRLGIDHMTMPAGIYGSRSMWGEPDVVGDLIQDMLDSARESGNVPTDKEVSDITVLMTCAACGMDEICDTLFEQGEEIYDSVGMSAVREALDRMGFHIGDDGRVSCQGKDLDLLLASRGMEWYGRADDVSIEDRLLCVSRDEMGRLIGISVDGAAHELLEDELWDIATTGREPDAAVPFCRNSIENRCEMFLDGAERPQIALGAPAADYPTAPYPIGSEEIGFGLGRAGTHGGIGSVGWDER